MSTAQSRGSFFNGSAHNSSTTSTVLPGTKQDDVAKAEMLPDPPHQEDSLSYTSICHLALPIAYKQIISLIEEMPDQQDIEEWDRARVSVKLRWRRSFMACYLIAMLDNIILLLQLPAVVPALFSLLTGLPVFGYILFPRGLDRVNSSASEFQAFVENQPQLFWYGVLIFELCPLVSGTALLVAVVDAIRNASTK